MLPVKRILVPMGVAFCVLFCNHLNAQSSVAEKYLDEGKSYFDQGEWEKVVGVCKKAIEIEPNYLDAYFAMGRAYAMVNKYDDAIAAFEKTIETKENYTLGYIGLGSVYMSQWENQKALDVLHKAVNVDPDNAAAYVALAGAYQNLGEFKKALELLEKAINVNDLYGDVYVGMAEVYASLNDFGNTKDNYKKAIETYRSQGAEWLAKQYEDKLKNVENSYLKIYLKSREVAEVIIVEEVDDYLKVRDCKVPDLSLLKENYIGSWGGSFDIDKRNIIHVELHHSDNISK